MNGSRGGGTNYEIQDGGTSLLRARAALCGDTIETKGYFL